MSKRYDLAASSGGGFFMQESEYGNWVTWGEHYKLQADYNDLLYQVQQKVPNETRHETAKRIIHQHEASSDNNEASQEANNG